MVPGLPVGPKWWVSHVVREGNEALLFYLGDTPNTPSALVYKLHRLGGALEWHSLPITAQPLLLQASPAWQSFASGEERQTSSPA